MSSFAMSWAVTNGYAPGVRAGIGYGATKPASLKKDHDPASTTRDETSSLKELSSLALRLGSSAKTCLCAPWNPACSNRTTWLSTELLIVAGPALGRSEVRSSFAIPTATTEG